MKAKLIWSSNFAKCNARMFENMQTYVDKECLRQMTPYVPVGLPRFKNSGKLRDSAKIAQPGKIVYTAPFAKSDYYAVKNHKPPHGGNPKGTRLWFEVMKKNHGAQILRGAAAIAKKR